MHVSYSIYFVFLYLKCLYFIRILRVPALILAMSAPSAEDFVTVCPVPGTFLYFNSGSVYIRFGFRLLKHSLILIPVKTCVQDIPFIDD